jgi:transcriptional regulator with XRE-family HTH domain
VACVAVGGRNEAQGPGPGWLRRERERRNMLQGALAKRLGVSQQSLSHYENGKVRIPDEIAAKVARLWNLSEIDVRRALGMYVPEQLRGREPLPPEPSFPEDALRLPKGVKLTDLEPHEQLALEKIVDAFIESVRADER